MADESINTVLNDIKDIGENNQEDSKDSIMDTLEEITKDSVDAISEEEELKRIRKLAKDLAIKKSSNNDNSSTYLGSVYSGIKDSVLNKGSLLFTGWDTQNVTTSGDRTAAGELDTEGKQLAYSFGHEFANLIQNIIISTKAGATFGATGSVAGPVGTVAGAGIGAAAGFATSALYNSLVMSAEVYKDSYNDALNRGYKESDAKWEAYEKSGATFGLEYLSQYIPFGKLGKVTTKVLPKPIKQLVNKGIIQIEGGIVKVLDKAGFKKAVGEATKKTTGITAKEAATKFASKRAKGITAREAAEKYGAKQFFKEGGEAAVEEYSEEALEEIAHQTAEISNDPNKTSEDFSWKQVNESGMGGAVMGAALRSSVRPTQKGIEKASQVITNTKERYKYGKKVSEDITNVDDKTITVDAREKTIEAAKREMEYNTAADKQSLADTELQNKIIDSEGNLISYKQVKDDEHYTFKNNEGVEKSVTGKEAKALWKEAYKKNKQMYLDDALATNIGSEAFSKLFSIKDSKGNKVDSIFSLNPEEEYEINFGGRIEKANGSQAKELAGKYLQETVHMARKELGLGEYNPTKEKGVVSRKTGNILDQLKLQQTNVDEFYKSHKVIDLNTNMEVAPNEITAHGRYKVIHNGGLVVEEEISGLGLSILEKYTPSVKSDKRTPIAFNLGDSVVDFARYGSGKINKHTLTVQSPDGPKEYRLQSLFKNGWKFNDWDKLSPNREFRLIDSNNRVYTYSVDQLDAIKALATRNATIADPDFISENIVRNSKGEVVEWNNISDLDFSERYSIEHNGTIVGENLSSKAVTLYKSMAQNPYTDVKNSNTYIYMKASSQYEGAPGTLYIRANDPTNTTYIGDNTDVMGDTVVDYEKELLSEKQKQQTRYAILQAIKQSKTKQSKSNDTQLNTDEATNIGTTTSAYKQKTNTKENLILQHQSEFSGGASPETFNQVIEDEWADDFIFSKEDIVPMSREEALFTIKSDVEKLLDIYGNDINKVIKGDDTIKIGKEHIRATISSLAKNLNYKMLNELKERGINGKHEKDAVYGVIATKQRYFRIRESRDYKSALHELGHGIFQDGLFGKGKEGLAKKLSTTNEMGDFISEMHALFTEVVSKKSNIDLSAYEMTAIPEELFAEAFRVFASEPFMENTFKRYAPKTFAALDAYLTETNSWTDIKKLRTIVQYYNNQTPVQRAIANLSVPTTDVFRQVFSPAWWKKVSLKKIAAQIMSYTTDDMAGLRYATKDLGIESGSDEVELYRSIGNDMAHRLISEDGCNFAGQSLKGFGFKNLVEIMRPIINLYGKQGEDRLAAGLWAQATLGEYVGNERVLTKLKQLDSKIMKHFTMSFALMRKISEENWREFINPADTVAADIKNADSYGMSAEEVAKLINKFKKQARELITDEDIYLARSDKLLQKELEEIQNNTEDDDDIKKYKIQSWKARVFREALRQNFKQTASKDVTNTGMELSDAIAIYDDIFVTGENSSMYAQAAEDYHNFQIHLLKSIAGASPEMKYFAERMLENASGWHAPLLRQFADDEQKASPHYLLVRREGSDKPISNLFDNTVKQVVAMCNAASRSATKNFLIHMTTYTGSGLYIREITEPSNKTTLTMKNFREAALAAKEEKLQELRDRGVEITTEVATKVNEMIEELEKLNISAFDLFTPTQEINKDRCEFSYYDPDQKKMRFFETEKDIYQSFNKPTYSNGLAKAGKVLQLITVGMKLGLITYNPAFLLFTNPVRDTLTLSWKGDTPLVLTGNRFLDTNPLNTVPGAIWQVAKAYTDFALHRMNPDSFKLMDYFGLGYNTKNNTYRNLQTLALRDSSNKVKNLSRNPLKAMLQIGDSFFESLGSLDKLARVAQLKAMLKKDGLSASNFDVNRRNVAAMILDKQTLVSNGITPEIINKYLTDEQKAIWNDTKLDEEPMLDLSENQIQNISKMIDSKDLHRFTKEQRIKYAKALRMCTTDFARGGELLRGLNKAFLFVQPAFNGSAQSIEKLKERIATGHIDEVLANIVTVFAAGLAYEYLSEDDEDEDEQYMWRGIPIKIGDTSWRIPALPEDMVWFQAARYLMKDSPKDYQRFIMSFFNSLNPLGSLSGVIGITGSMVTGKRINDIGDTRFGQPIVPEYIRKQYGKKHPELYYNESTSWLARTIGRFVSNPMTVQYYMDQFGISIWDNIIENLAGVRRVTRTQSGLDIQNNSRRWADLKAPFGIDTHTYRTRSQDALEDMLDEAKGEYYVNVPPSKRKSDKGLTAEQRKLRMNYYALNQVNKTISIYNKLESIAQTQSDRNAIKKDKTAYMKEMIKLLNKQPGLEGRYYYFLSNKRKSLERNLGWQERVLSEEASKQLNKK